MTTLKSLVFSALLVSTVSVISFSTPVIAAENIMNIQLKGNEVRTDGVIKSIEMIGHPMFIVTMGKSSSGVVFPFVININEAGIDEDEFASLNGKDVTFIYETVKETQLHGIEFNGKLIANLIGIQPEWKSATGIIHTFHMLPANAGPHLVTLDLPNGKTIVFSKHIDGEMVSINNQQVKVYYEAWTNDTIHKLSAAAK